MITADEPMILVANSARDDFGQKYLYWQLYNVQHVTASLVGFIITYHKPGFK